MGEREPNNEPVRRPTDTSHSEGLLGGLIGPAEDEVDLAEQARVFGVLFPTAAATPVKVGRFELLRRLGRGGMGEVYVAYDEQLDRQIALKLLLRERSADEHARDRMLREAQVLARLSHPNVVQIYEAGVHEGQVFLAMELVEGVTLRQWLAQRPEDAAARPWREVLPVMIQAGRGLAAAHAAGLTHRDFKPDNVLVGSDGRVRVLDFGLARPGAEVDDETTDVQTSSKDETVSTSQTEMARSASSGPRREIALLTAPGRVVGTLAYMSPEQLAARPLDGRTDQFSFCVTLYEALYGERPFKASTLVAYLLMVTEGMIEEPASRTQVPRWLRELVRRGLSVSPHDRFADMEALLRELSRPRRRAWILGGMFVAMMATGAGGAIAGQPSPCEIDASALSGTWDDERREQLREAFAATELPLAGASTRTAEQTLDDWSAGWVVGQRSACEATRVQGTQSEAMLDLRTSCLERQRRETAVVVDLLTTVDRQAAARAAELLGQLPDTDVCENPRLAETTHPLPSDPTERRAVLEGFARLTRARALAGMGRPAQADALLVQLEQDSEELRHLPLELERRLLDGERLLWLSKPSEGVPLVRAVIHDAEIAGLDEISATARVALSVNIGSTWGRPELRESILEEAEIAVQRLGRRDDPRRSALQMARAALLDGTGEHEAALAMVQETGETAAAAGLMDRMGQAELESARLLHRLGRSDEAVTAYARARRIYEGLWGPASDDIAAIEKNLGVLELERGRLDEASNHLQRARALYTPIVASDSPLLAGVSLSEAKLTFMLGDVDGAAAAFEAVTRLDTEPLYGADAWEGLGVTRFYQGDHPGSVAAYREAMKLRLMITGPRHRTVGVLHSNMGESLEAQGDHQGALAAYTKALDVLESALPHDHPELAFPYKGRGSLRLNLGDTPGALVDLRRAHALHEANPGEPVEHADVEFTLARALEAAGERQAALDLARAAQARLLEHHQDRMAATVAIWLREREPRNATARRGRTTP